MKETDVYGLYKESWTGEIVEDAFSHPAKFSRALIRFIYRHAIEQGYIRPGDTVVDCFAGVGLGALDAMRYGLHWRGCELEARFVTLGRQNIDLWNARYAAAFPGWGTAQLYQGDSRQLASVLREAGACVASPPYVGTDLDGKRPNAIANLQRKLKAGELTGRESIRIAQKGTWNENSNNNQDDYGSTPGQLGAMPEGDVGAVVSSPPYASGEKGHPSLGSVNRDEWGTDGRDIAARRGVDGRYGDNDGQLSNMPEGTVDGVVSSPPFLGAHGGTADANSLQSRSGGPIPGIKGDAYGRTEGQLGAMPEGTSADAIVSSPPYADSVDGSGEGPGTRWDSVHHAPENANKRSSDNGYGVTEGNLGAMGACVSSPPFENCEGTRDYDFMRDHYEKIGRNPDGPGARSGLGGHLEHPSNIGNDTGDTFWTAAKAIVEQVHAVLRPGGYAIWITGDFVRNGQRVHFGQQWLQLCQACGFEPVEWIRCWKREPGPTQLGLLGDDHDHTIDRVSFFRRLSNKRNPDAAILNEDVIICRKE